VARAFTAINRFKAKRDGSDLNLLSQIRLCLVLVVVVVVVVVWYSTASLDWLRHVVLKGEYHT
jgi:hypothetical protein